MNTINHTEAPTAATALTDSVSAILGTNDKAKTLSLCALVKRDPGGEPCTNAEVNQAIKYLKDFDGDSHTPLFESGIQYLKERYQV
ncbi:MAG: hypothetical protein EOM51_10740 [Clostridia bacterium]|nr:hypothetical protein [Clostridia bacterium]